MSIPEITEVPESILKDSDVNDDHVEVAFDASLLPDHVSVDDLNDLVERHKEKGVMGWSEIRDIFETEGEIDFEDEAVQHVVGVLEDAGYVIDDKPGEMSFSEAAKIGNITSESGRDASRNYMRSAERFPVLNSKQSLRLSRRISESYTSLSLYMYKVPYLASAIHDRIVRLGDKEGQYTTIIDSVGTGSLKRDYEKETGRDVIEEHLNEMEELRLAALHNSSEDDEDDEDEDDDSDSEVSGGSKRDDRVACKYALILFHEMFNPWAQMFDHKRHNRLGEPLVTDGQKDYLEQLSEDAKRIRLEHSLTIRLSDEFLTIYRDLKRIDGKLVQAAGKIDRTRIQEVKDILQKRKTKKQNEDIRKLAGFTEKQMEVIDEEYRQIAEKVKCDLPMFREQANKVRELQKTWLSERNTMVVSNLKLVFSITKKFPVINMEMIDLVQEGNLGMFKAIDKFDYRKGFRFSTYAVQWITRQIKKALSDKSSTIRVPSHMHEAEYKVKKAASSFLSEHGREPTHEELAKLTAIPLQRVKTTISNLRRQVSLESPVGASDDGGSATLGDFMSDRVTSSPLDQVNRKNLSVHIDEVLSDLPERDEMVLRGRFGIGCDRMTLEEIGDKFKVTRERIRQIEASALKRLSKPTRGRKLRAYHHYDTDYENNEES